MCTTIMIYDSKSSISFSAMPDMCAHVKLNDIYDIEIDFIYEIDIEIEDE